jgi:hypothetical protein
MRDVSRTLLLVARSVKTPEPTVGFSPGFLEKIETETVDLEAWSQGKR